MEMSFADFYDLRTCRGVIYRMRHTSFLYALSFMYVWELRQMAGDNSMKFIVSDEIYRISSCNRARDTSENVPDKYFTVLNILCCSTCRFFQESYMGIARIGALRNFFLI